MAADNANLAIYDDRQRPVKIAQLDVLKLSNYIIPITTSKDDVLPEDATKRPHGDTAPK